MALPGTRRRSSIYSDKGDRPSVSDVFKRNVLLRPLNHGESEQEFRYDHCADALCPQSFEYGTRNYMFAILTPGAQMDCLFQSLNRGAISTIGDFAGACRKALRRSFLKMRRSMLTRCLWEYVFGINITTPDDQRIESYADVANQLPRDCQDSCPIGRNLALSLQDEYADIVGLGAMEKVAIYLMANLIKRPIFVYARTCHGGNGNNGTPVASEGIYLPLDCDPNECSKNPVLVMFDASAILASRSNAVGHFSALSFRVTSEELESSNNPVVHRYAPLFSSVRAPDHRRHKKKLLRVNYALAEPITTDNNGDYQVPGNFLDEGLYASQSIGLIRKYTNLGFVRKAALQDCLISDRDFDTTEGVANDWARDTEMSMGDGNGYLPFVKLTYKPMPATNRTTGGGCPQPARGSHHRTVGNRSKGSIKTAADEGRRSQSAQYYNFTYEKREVKARDVEEQHQYETLSNS